MLVGVRCPQELFQAFFTKCQMSQGSLLRVKLHPVFMEKNRLYRRGEREGNFNIFHLMFAGMTNNELAEFHLSGYSLQNLKWMHHKHDGDDQS